MFVLMQLPNAGDDLQAIKKGVMELADLVVINKADIDADAAMRAQAQITSSLRLLGISGNPHDPHSDKHWLRKSSRECLARARVWMPSGRPLRNFQRLQTANGLLAASANTRHWLGCGTCRRRPQAKHLRMIRQYARNCLH